jgi:hypothetical protein
MRLRVLVILLALVSSIASARVGESGRRCEQRYGAPVRTSDNGSLVTYKSHGLSIVVHFTGGTADMLSFHKLPLGIEEPPPPFTDAEVRKLLEENGGERLWETGAATTSSTAWRTEDGALRAILDVATAHLIIYTATFAEAVGAGS